MNNELIINEFDKLFPDPKCELNYTKDYELLLSVMLSAQTTDKSVNNVTDKLYKEYNTLEKLSTLNEKDISEYIKRIGFFRTKSNHFYKIVEEIKKIGYVPNDRNYLESLPGVGRKTASVVLGILFDEPSFAVDTHVYRVSKRLKITKEKDNLLVTEKKLKKYFPIDKWNRVNTQMVLFGRYYCTSRKPQCDTCFYKNLCDYTNKKISNK
ncbi:MAG: endonuclease III [Tenericutes bacterium]|nr:endonuclease III [Mycoplasmatota bacterium]